MGRKCNTYHTRTQYRQQKKPSFCERLLGFSRTVATYIFDSFKNWVPKHKTTIAAMANTIMGQ